MKFEVEIIETSARTIEVEAPSEEEALKIVNEMYKNIEIVIDAEDFVDVEFKVLEREQDLDLDR